MSLDLDELSKIFECAAHTRDLPQYKNIGRELSARLQEIEDSLAPKEEKKPTSGPRAIPANVLDDPNYVPPKPVTRPVVTP